MEMWLSLASLGKGLFSPALPALPLSRLGLSLPSCFRENADHQ